MGLNPNRLSPVPNDFQQKLIQDQQAGFARLEIDAEEPTEEKVRKIFAVLGQYVNLHFAPSFLPEDPQKNRELMAFGSRLEMIPSLFLKKELSREEALTTLAAQERNLKKDLDLIEREMEQILSVLKQTLSSVLQ